MSETTSITSIYDALPSTERVLAGANIAQADKRLLFSHMLPRRGAQDKVIGRLLAALAAWSRKGEAHLNHLTELEREEVYNTILNQFSHFLNENSLSSILSHTPHIKLPPTNE